MNVAIIPARGGSKRIPGKNVKPFAGVPIISYSIRAAVESGLFERVLVSTDSEAIAAVAREWGAEAPFLRPPELSDDHTPTAPVVEHALEWLESAGQAPRLACCIYATAPFLEPRALREGYELLTSQGVSSVFSVTRFSFPISRALKVTDDGHLAMFWPEHETTRSNDLPEAYHDAGQFYWLDCAHFRANPRLYAADALPVVLPAVRVRDIDTPEDWEMAEYMFKALQRSEDASDEEVS